MEHFKANGKLLISGEYAVLDGALALAIPTKLGQSLEVNYSEPHTENPKLAWNAFLHDESLWFSAEFDLKTFEIILSSDQKLAKKLNELFQAIRKLNPDFLRTEIRNVQCKTRLEFPKDWGFGSSSTLVYLLAQFAEVDAFELNKLTFNTSGYDIACASAKTPIFYQNTPKERRVEAIEFQPKFADQLYFVHLNQKQDTQISVSKNYKDLPRDLDWLNGISALTYNLSQVETPEEFEVILNLHEEMISSKLGLEKVKEQYFSDYEGSVKSLGAWGGDFVLITERPNCKAYFRKKGFQTILRFHDIFL